jgi:adenosylhomocysteine nucleosidase
MASMTTNATNPKQRPLGIIFALPIEAHTFERRLGNATKYQGQRSVIYEGHVSDHPVVWTISGVGREAARNAAQLIIDGHQPHTLISAGFAGALAPHLEHGTVLVPERILDANQQCIYPLGHSDQSLWPGGKIIDSKTTLITVDSIITSKEEKTLLREESHADLVDMESAAVACIAQEAGIQFFAVRAISDTSEETLPPEVSRLSQPQSPMHRFGAALAAITRRPAAVTDLWRLWEQGVSCSRTLADRLEQIAQTIQ